MYFSIPHCPHCGQLVSGTVEILRGVAELDPTNDGQDLTDPRAIKFQYSGQTTVWWDEQRTETDPKTDHVRVICPEGHEWSTPMHDEPRPSSPGDDALLVLVARIAAFEESRDTETAEDELSEARALLCVISETLQKTLTTEPAP